MPYLPLLPADALALGTCSLTPLLLSFFVFAIFLVV